MRSRTAFCNAGSILALVLFLLVPKGRGEEVCKAVINCPQNWDGDTLNVDEDVVSVSGSFEHCSPVHVIEGPGDDLADTISLMIIIDHSASMSIKDSLATRYELANRLIDTLAELSPASEVGIAVFSNQLLHSHEDDDYYVQVNNASDWPDSYVPLTKLDSTADGVDAVAKLKQSIALSDTEEDKGDNRKLINGFYGQTGRHDGRLKNQLTGYNGTTDISLAFEAARQAFQTARYSAERQVIVFLSDGVASTGKISENDIVDLERQPNVNDYIEGTDLPTTFTAFWILQNETVPNEIKMMTDSIKANGYSSRNIYSQVWLTQGSDDDLLATLLSMSLGEGTGVVTSRPKALEINGKPAVSFQNSQARLEADLPLTGNYTDFTMTFTWHWEKPWDRDTTATYTFTVARSGTPDQGYIKECWASGSLELLHEGVPVSVVDPEWTQLQMRYHPPAEYPIDSASFEVTNASASDRIYPEALNYASHFGAHFVREVGQVRNDDDILQNGISDSIVIVYRNVEYPLDTLRRAYAVKPKRDLAVRQACYLDRDADGFADMLRIYLGDSLTQDEADLIRPSIQVQTSRMFAMDSVIADASRLNVFLAEPVGDQETPFTGLHPNERLYISAVSDLPSGGTFPATDVLIVDSMAPVVVSGRYFDIVTENAWDTLEVSFSELVRPIAAAQPFLFRHTGESEPFAIRLNYAGAGAEGIVFAAPPVVSQSSPRVDDSLWISRTGGITDTTSNVQLNEANARRWLEYFKVFRVESATYIDTGEMADGRIDIVRVRMDQVPDDTLLDALVETLSLPRSRELGFSRSDMVITDEGFDIHVTPDKDAKRFTGVDDLDVLTVDYTQSDNNGIVQPVVVPITDSIAPVLIDAWFRPAVVTDPDNVPDDTITLTFSEPVGEISFDRPVTLRGKDGEYTMLLRDPVPAGDRSVRFIVDSIVGTEFPAAGDEAWVNPDAGVVDRSSARNVQTRKSEPVSLRVRPYEYVFSVSVLPGHGDPRITRIPDALRSAAGISETHGMALVVRPTGKVAEQANISAKISIFDAVGNMVLKDRTATPNQSRDYFTFVWDGVNENGRMVGTGTYLAVVIIRDDNGISALRRMKIGVKR